MNPKLLSDDPAYQVEYAKLLKLQAALTEGQKISNRLNDSLDPKGNAPAVTRQNAEIVTAALIENPDVDLKSAEVQTEVRVKFFAQNRRNMLLKTAIVEQQKHVARVAGVAGRKAAALVEGDHEQAVRKIVFGLFHLSDLLAEESAIRDLLIELGHHGNNLIAMPLRSADPRVEGSRGEVYVKQAVTFGFVKLAELKKYLSPKKLEDLELTTRADRERILGLEIAANK